MPVVPVNEYARYARDLSAAAEGVDEQADAALDLVGRGALATAKARVPVDTGELRASLFYARNGEDAIVGARAEHAAFVEYGTSDTAPQPFIGPAFDVWGERLVREVEEIRDDVVKALS